MGETIERFRIEVPDAVLEDLQERLARTRFPDQIEGSGWGYGTDRAYLEELCHYWREKFDWRAQEAALNRFEHFRTDIEGRAVHFIHARSRHDDALPLVITHGWPGSVFEFHKIIGPLCDPEAHGGSAADAFHVVCPSMPGYGWSDPPREPGFDVQRVAEVVAKLMARLGYARYGAQGGDWGAIVTTLLGRIDPQHVCGIHLNMVVAGPPPGVANPAEGLAPHELEALASMGEFQKNETGYQQIQGTKPQTLGYALNDSPAGLAAWIVEKFRTWSDCDGDVERCFTKDELLTNIMIYWVTQSITASTRLYCETMRAGRFGPADGRVEVPTAGAIFPKEIIRPPRAWAERAFDIRRWTRFEAGGHFAALEQPEALVEDLRAFYRDLRT
ncbi:MAG: epoxide hydrolase [Deltaproteobacteria bacterium]|nr:MAG: epoxide hydrolase [Deltaproteobacteria bacterium]